MFRHAGFVVPDVDSAPDSLAQECNNDNTDEVALLSSQESKGIVVDMSSYVSVDENVQTRREDAVGSIIEEVLEMSSEGISDDIIRMLVQGLRLCPARQQILD